MFENMSARTFHSASNGIYILHSKIPHTFRIESHIYTVSYYVYYSSKTVLCRCSNQFMPATFVVRGEAPLRELLHQEASTIEVTLRSALREAREAAAASPKDVPDMVFFQDWAEPAHRNFVRKAASDFGCVCVCLCVCVCVYIYVRVCVYLLNCT